MKLNHIALRVRNIELEREFYSKYFGMKSGDRYVNEKKGFTSYFLSFEIDQPCIELINLAGLDDPEIKGEKRPGLAHIALSAGSRDAVNHLTERLRGDGFTVISEPRITGDGYYESVVLDPEGNIIELTV